MNTVPAVKTRRWQVVIWSVISALAVFLSLRSYRGFQVGAAGDDAMYVVLARSLASDRGFGLIHTPAAEPLPSPFPFGYPLLLAPLVAWLPDDLEILKTPSLLATLANGALLFWGWQWFSRRSSWWGLAVSCIYLLLPSVIDHSRMVMSEAVFTTLCLVAVLLTEQMVQGKRTRWRALLLGAVLAYAVFTRSVGVFIAFTLAAYLLWRKGRAGWRAIAQVCAAGLALTALLLVLTPVGPDGLLPLRYLTESNNSLYLIARQIGGATGAAVQSDPPGSTQDTTRPVPQIVLQRAGRHLTVDLRSAVLPFGGGDREEQLATRLGIPWLSTAVRVLVLALVVVGGLAWWIEEGPNAFTLVAVAYFGVILLWNWEGPRLLYPVLPQLVLCLLTGVGAVSRTASTVARRWLPDAWISRYRPRAWSSQAATVGAALLLGCLATSASYRLTDSRLHVGDLSARTEWLRANTPTSTVVMSEQPVIDFLYGGRHTVSQPRSLGSTPDLERHLSRERVGYILVGPALTWQALHAPTYSRSAALLLPQLDELRATGRLTEVHSAPQDRIVVYRSHLP